MRLRAVTWISICTRGSDSAAEIIVAAGRTALECSPIRPGRCASSPYSEGLRERIWWGSSSNATSMWAARLGVSLQSSTLKDDDSGEPLHVQQRIGCGCSAHVLESILKYVAPGLGWR